MIVNVASRIAPTYCQDCCAATCWVEETCVEQNILKFWQCSLLGNPTLLFRFYVNIIFLISREESEWLFFFVLEQHALCRDLHVDSAHVN